MLAASLQARAQNKPQVTKVIASSKNFKWCDTHVCVEPAHYLGLASYYGKERQGRKMANGQRFDYHKLTAACWFLPLGTQVQVTNLKNGRTVTVTITDRGPAHRLHRVIDLSFAAALQLDFVGDGLTVVWMRPFTQLETVDVVILKTLIGPQIEADTTVKASIIEK